MYDIDIDNQTQRNKQQKKQNTKLDEKVKLKQNKTKQN